MTGHPHIGSTPVEAASLAVRSALSIVIPLYNRAATIGRAVLSVGRSAAALPGGEAIEIVVVDDGSSDGSAEAARSLAGGLPENCTLRVVEQPNGGPGAARNRGASLATADHIAFLDSDDLWFDWTLAQSLEVLADNRDAVLVFLHCCNFECGTEPRPVAALNPKASVFESFLDAVQKEPRATYATSNVIMRKDTFDRLGGFHPIGNEDSDFFLRADAQGRCVVVTTPDLVGREKRSGDQLTGNCDYWLSGLDAMLSAEREGRYPHGRDGDPRRTHFLAGSAIFTSRVAFATGRPVLGYRLLIAHLGLMARAGRGSWIWRLALTPLLSLVRPQTYRFRLRPESTIRSS